jgi:alginate O-acetyltransferase complex protein AlgI
MEITAQNLVFPISILFFSLGTRFLPSPKARQWLLLLLSYLFYVYWEPIFLLVLIASSLMNYGWAAVLRRRPTLLRLWIGVGLNLLFLGFFKYLPHMLEAVPESSGEFDLLRQIVMPLGISFWTFQALSYLFDIYREEELDPTLVEFCLYMAFWPTVLSGPICRLSSMLPQFRQAYTFNWDDISAGTLRIIQGLLMKFVLAQVLAVGLSPGEGVNAAFDRSAASWSGTDVWLLSIGFGLQLFFDFAGYSHIVIGAARLFGIRLDENFDRPYLSTTPSLFWTRWHMSLSFWIRDYVFFPLAAVWRGHRWPYLALVISMTLFGLWHAAKATLILWGLYHGLLLVCHRLGQKIRRRVTFNFSAYWGGLLSWISTFAAVSLGWILFRARDLDQAWTMFGSVVSPSSYQQFALSSRFYLLIFCTVGGYFVYEAMALLLIRYRARHRDNLQSMPGMRCSELLEFFAERMWWWKTPIVLGFLVLGGSFVFAQRAPTEGFVYTLF